MINATIYKNKLFNPSKILTTKKKWNKFSCNLKGKLLLFLLINYFIYPNLVY